MKSAIFIGLVLIAGKLSAGSLPAQEGKTYAVRSPYASTETCDYRTQGIFIVWWDRRFDYAAQAAEVLDTLANVRKDCLETYHMADPPNPAAGYYYNVYIHNGSDLFKGRGWAMGQGTDENRMPYLTIPSGYAKRNNSGLQHEGFHIFQYKANSPGFAYRGDSQWFVEASANWYATTKHPGDIEEYICASAITSNPQMTMWYSFDNREPGDQDNWQRGNHQYGMNCFLNYLTDARKVPKTLVAGGFYAKTAELPQEYLYHQLGAAKFRDLYADFAAYNVSGFPFFPPGTEARAARELKQYGKPLDVHPVVQTYTNAGTGGCWYRPTQDYVTRGWGYNVYRITNSLKGSYTFCIKGDAQGSASAPAEFRARVVVKNGKSAQVYPVKMSNAVQGQRKVKVKASDSDIYFVVAATPGCFRGNQTYSYQIEIASPDAHK